MSEMTPEAAPVVAPVVVAAPSWFTDAKPSTSTSKIPAGVIEEAVSTLRAGGPGSLYAAVSHPRDEQRGGFADELRMKVAAGLGLAETWVKALEREGPDGRWYSGVKYRTEQVQSRKKTKPLPAPVAVNADVVAAPVAAPAPVVAPAPTA